MRITPTVPIVIASQAPGLRAHQSGVPFDDASGVRLREWLGTPPPVFYDDRRIAIVPMGFCFPGYDAQGGDKPPLAICRQTWHHQVFASLDNVRLIVCIGLYAARFHLERLGLPRPKALRMTDLVMGWRDYHRPRDDLQLFLLPHPSWRNTGWLKRHPWFETDVLPTLQQAVRAHTSH